MGEAVGAAGHRSRGRAVEQQGKTLDVRLGAAGPDLFQGKPLAAGATILDVKTTARVLRKSRSAHGSGDGFVRRGGRGTGDHVHDRRTDRGSHTSQSEVTEELTAFDHMVAD